MLGTASKSKDEIISDVPYGLRYKATPVLTDQQTYSLALRTYQERWPIGTDGEKEFWEYVLSARLNGDDDCSPKKSSSILDLFLF